MPQIEQVVIDSAFYIFPTLESAQCDDPGVGGTGFFISMNAEIEGYMHIYAVTCAHCLAGRSTAYVRYNLIEGGVDTMEISDWVCHPDGDDVAIAGLSLGEENSIKLCLIEVESFATKNVMEDQEIAVGTSVFMVGRFRGIYGEDEVIQTMRFGNISALPKAKLPTKRGKFESYLIEMRSLPGYSGSPVFAYQENAIKKGPVGNFWSIAHGLYSWLIGIDYCHIVDKVEIKNAQDEAFSENAYVEGASGLAGVIPVDRIVELLNDPHFEKIRKADMMDLSG
jgi:hypothetical protein